MYMYLQPSGRRHTRLEDADGGRGRGRRTANTTITAAAATHFRTHWEPRGSLVSPRLLRVFCGPFGDTAALCLV